MSAVPMLSVFQNTDSRPAVSTRSRTIALRRSAFKAEKWRIVDCSAPATLMDCTDAKVSPSDSVMRPVASRAATR